MSPALPTFEQATALWDGFHGHAQFCRESLRIRDKTGSVVPLNLSPGQAKLAAAIRRQRERNEAVRVVCLKARQVHMSVGAASEIFKQTAFLPGQNALSIAHDLKAAGNIFNYVGQFDHSYTPFQQLKKLKTLRSRKPTETTPGSFEWEGASKLTSATSRNVAGGRSGSIRHLHISEYGFFLDASGYMTGLIPSIPDDPMTTVIIESTANGIGNALHKLCQDAQDPNRAGGWVFVFFAWWEHPEYARPIHDMPKFMNSITKFEKDLIRLYALKPEQLHWRRWRIAQPEFNEEKFKQEYPSNPEEAFLTSGRPRFSMVDLGRMPIIRDPLAGELERVEIGTRTEIRFIANAEGKGMLRIWKRPLNGHNYTIGADSAEGIDVSDALGESDPDYCSAQVGDVDSGEQVAHLRERLTPAAFAQYLYDLGRWYNWAYLVPEANNTGIAVLEELLRLEYPIERIYCRQRQPDDRRPPRLQEIGWKTTSVTRPQLVSKVDRAIREQAIVIRDAVTLAECMTFVTKPNGRAEAAQGCHDDTVIGLALMTEGILTYPHKPLPNPNGLVRRSAMTSYRKLAPGPTEDGDRDREVLIRRY